MRAASCAVDRGARAPMNDPGFPDRKPGRFPMWLDRPLQAIHNLVR